MPFRDDIEAARAKAERLEEENLELLRELEAERAGHGTRSSRVPFSILVTGASLFVLLGVGGAVAFMLGAPSPAPHAPTTIPAPEPPATPVSQDDPLKGRFTLADATKGLEGRGPLVATIHTSKGPLTCRLFEDKAPLNVANFVGLATGKRTWKDPRTGAWVNRPAYDGTIFHRVIKGFMIQGGDPLGTGTGEPGYAVPDEIWPGAKHDRAGLLCTANRGPNTNGAQFFVTDGPASHLDNGHTIFGECSPIETVHEIASVETATGDRPTKAVTISAVTVRREEQ